MNGILKFDMNYRASKALLNEFAPNTMFKLIPANELSLLFKVYL